MKRMSLIIALLLAGCAASDIALNRRALQYVKSAAVAPFTSKIQLDGTILTETENIFTAALGNAGLNVIGSDKVDLLFREKQFGASGISGDDIRAAGKILGAEAVLSGEITIHDERQETVTRHRAGRFGMMIMDDDQERTEIKTYYRFRITLKLISTTDGSTILEMTNRYIEAEHDDYMPGFLSLDAYRRYTLKKMGEELTETIRRRSTKEP